MDFDALVGEGVERQFLIAEVGLQELLEGGLGEFSLQRHVLAALGVVDQQRTLLGNFLQLGVAAQLHLEEQILVDEVYCNLLQVVVRRPVRLPSCCQQKGAFLVGRCAQFSQGNGGSDGLDWLIHEVIHDFLGLHPSKLY
jgi:hypothetical protein